MTPFATIFTTALHWSRHWTHSQDVLTSSVQKCTPRPMTERDLDGFVTVVVDAFKSSPRWQYIHYPDKEYANYTWSCYRQAIQEQWDALHRNVTFVNVISVPTQAETEKVVSVAVWKWISPGQNTSITALPSSPVSITLPRVLSSRDDDCDFDCASHLDMNRTRAEDLDRQMRPVMDRYIYGANETQLYLNLLATHPDWDGHGLAGAQLETGIKEARARQVPVTLMSTQAGYPLYDSFGFHSVVNITYNMLDGLGTFWLEYMRLNTTA